MSVRMRVDVVGKTEADLLRAGEKAAREFYCDDNFLLKFEQADGKTLDVSDHHGPGLMITGYTATVYGVRP